MAYEGFFTITTRRTSVAPWDFLGMGKTEPLPELQPFYSVVAWPNFETSRHVRKAVRQLQNSGRKYYIANCLDPERTWRLLDDYHRAGYDTNWLTKQYFEMLRAASADPSVNFKLQCVELYCSDEDGTSSKQQALPLAGEIGFSIGRIYTSLSGWTQERTKDGDGTLQLVLLGRWLQRKGYAFWSLGHCYSPCMDYKRQLGHRVLPRWDFLALIRDHRGTFRTQRTGVHADASCTLGDGETCELHELVELN